MARSRLTIDELAAAVGMTSRNVRAYQSRGLVPPPDVQGRTGYYSDEHIERLELIKRMQAEGLNLNAVAWVLGAAERDTDELRAVREAALAPFVVEGAPVVAAATLAARLGGVIEPDMVARAVDLGVIELLDTGEVRVLMPALVRRAEELIGLGVPLPALLDVVVEMNDHTSELASVFLDLVREHLFARALRPGEPVDPDAVRAISAELKAIAGDVIVAALERALADQIDPIVTQLAQPPVDPAVAERPRKTRRPSASRPGRAPAPTPRTR